MAEKINHVCILAVKVLIQAIFVDRFWVAVYWGVAMIQTLYIFTALISRNISSHKKYYICIIGCNKYSTKIWKGLNCLLIVISNKGWIHDFVYGEGTDPFQVADLKPIFCKCFQKSSKKIFTVCKRSLRRLCFYRCLSVHVGGCPGPGPGGVYPGGCPGPGMGGGVGWGCPGPGPGGVSQHALRQTPPSADGYSCGQYTSYWNAFLFLCKMGWGRSRNQVPSKSADVETYQVLFRLLTKLKRFESTYNSKQYLAMLANIGSNLGSNLVQNVER